MTKSNGLPLSSRFAYRVLMILMLFACVSIAQAARAGDDEKILHTFTGGKDGAEAFGGLVSDSAGNLYGTTLTGGNLKYCGGVAVVWCSG